MRNLDLTGIISTLIYISTLTGCRPFDRSTPLYNIYKTFVIFVVLTVTLAQFGYMVTNFSNVERVGTISCFFIGVTGAFIKIINMDRKFRLIEEIRNDLSKITTFQPKNYKEMKILKDGLFLSNRIFRLFSFLLTLLFVIFQSHPVAIKWKKLPIDIWIPDFLDEKIFYIFAYFYQILYGIYIVYASVSIDCLFAVLTIQIGTQSELLNERIRDLSTDLKETHMKLTFCIQHHQKIIG